MSDEDKLQESLAAWVPPWQRAQTVPSAGDSAAEPELDADQPDGEPDDDDSDVQQPETDVYEGGSTEADANEHVSSGTDVYDSALPGTDVYEGVSPEAALLEEMDLDVESDPVDASEAALEPDAGVDTPETLTHLDAALDELISVDVADGAAVDLTVNEALAVAEAVPADEAPVTRRPDDLRGALEAILLVVDEPVSDAMLADVLDAQPAEVVAELQTLALEYDEARRGFELRRVAGGWRLYTRGEFSAYVEKFVLDGQSVRLTQAALETLAVVAYQQPVTRSRMAAIRGVNCDGVVRTLVTRGLIEECGTQPESGAFLYRTTQLFLEKLGLDTIEQLPPLAPFLPDDVNGLVDAER